MKNSAKRLSISIITLVILCTCLCVISFALGMVVYEVNNNTFATGTIDIDLNGGEPVITANEFLFEPGATVEKSFYIKNNGTWAVWYKLYFSEVSGNLGDVLEVTIKNKDGTILMKGKLAELTEKNVPAMEDELAMNEKQEMTIVLHLPEYSGNNVQGGNLTFELSAVTVQTKNNTGKEFE